MTPPPPHLIRPQHTLAPRVRCLMCGTQTVPCVCGYNHAEVEAPCCAACTATAQVGLVLEERRRQGREEVAYVC